jgi:hypothetical protein
MFKHEVKIQEPHSIEAVATLARMLSLAEPPIVLRLNDHLTLVQGSTGFYTVTKREGDVWKCSCPAAGFGRPCKHLKALNTFLQEEGRLGSTWDSRGNIMRERAGFRPTLQEVA